jgi:hypothetical protein
MRALIARWLTLFIGALAAGPAQAAPRLCGVTRSADL